MAFWRKSGGILAAALAEVWWNSGGSLAEVWRQRWRKSGGILAEVWWNFDMRQTELSVYVYDFFQISFRFDFEP